MRYLLQAGTDAASLLLFDPAALPADFERQFQSEPVEVLDRLTRCGQAFWINVDGDGSYLLHAYVDEPIPRGTLGVRAQPRGSDRSFKFPRASSS